MAGLEVPVALDVRPFLPTRRLETSLAFYEKLGWRRTYVDERVAVVTLAGSSLILQAYYQKDWAENSMLYVQVEDADAWRVHAERVCEGFEGARVVGTKDEPHGRVTHVIDPAGVLLHFVAPSARAS